VPDLREEECKHWDYPTDLPKASVILVHHNEGWSTLLRTVHSVLNRSPAKFLEEIILVDDKSELEHCGKPLEDELKKPYYRGKVRIVRNAEREGLIRSRNNGAVAAKGEVVVFLDAHCEVNENWLPPLLAPIHADR
jgi:polypeptide N-acetylgalactosaminyltransferase